MFSWSFLPSKLRMKSSNRLVSGLFCGDGINNIDSVQRYFLGGNEKLTSNTNGGTTQQPRCDLKPVEAHCLRIDNRPGMVERESRKGAKGDASDCNMKKLFLFTRYCMLLSYFCRWVTRALQSTQ
mmetsp:Transcript_7555/g.16702  ORF Transcript_7555/g.16702 Transcript_7555/m.16702 type:complete len:125 (+) Transcript_7555:1199-1573(+)